jgi:hypothetical protein
MGPDSIEKEHIFKWKWGFTVHNELPLDNKPQCIQRAIPLHLK